MLVNNNKYLETIESIKQEIANARYKATASVNKELIILYYNIGKIINNHKTWGNKFIESLLTDIALEFPNSKGYSVRNLKYMAKFAELYPDEEFVQQVVVQIPWGHNIVLMDKFDDENIREWYIKKSIENALVQNVTNLLLELGTVFAFVGNQYHLNVAGDDFYIDLLFYNINLHCYVVIELKTGEFKPEYAGKLNFYLSAVDDIVKTEQDNPSIGLLLCKSKNNVVAEYSLRDMSKPIGVSEYKITSQLPETLEKQLPSVEDIQKRIK